MKAYIIYENEDWMPPLRRALKAQGVPFEEWFVNEGHFDVTSEPPAGVFINRMSPSSHTRGHEMGVEHTRHLLAWLDHHGRRIINGPHVFELEISKARQHAALEQTGIRTPHTRVVTGGAEALRCCVLQLLTSPRRLSPSTTAAARGWACSCSNHTRPSAERLIRNRSTSRRMA